jgi:DNA-binding NarL/FixJ family response regulator
MDAAVERKPRLLFVDDEPLMLSALRRVLIPERTRWAMTFVSSGKEALQAFQEEVFDVIVSDMRMPGMDGDVLLGEVHRLYPEVFCVVLSGYAEPGTASSVMRVAQRYLSKPCDPVQLVEAIEHALLGKLSLD